MTRLIAGALHKLGGEGHRNDVIGIIQAGASPADAHALRHAAIACFERNAGNPREDGVMFGSRFGPQSHRWTLGCTALRQLELMKEGGADAAPPSSASLEDIRSPSIRSKPPGRPL